VRKKFYVMLEPPWDGALLDLSMREDRYPQQQAARLIREGLERAGAIPKEATDMTESARKAVPA
jgi:hypothetical protein